MTREALIERLVELLAEEFEVEKEVIRPEAKIKTALALSSLEYVDFVAVIDYEFGVKIPTKELLKIETFEQLYDYLTPKVENR